MVRGPKVRLPGAPAPPGVLRLACVGDVMLGTAYPDAGGLPPHDGAGLLDAVTPLLKRADLTIGNLEGPLADSGTTKKQGPHSFAFRVPTRYVRHLKAAGFDLFTLANNHAGDFGSEGRASTQRTLEAAGLRHVGGDTAPIFLTVKGRRIAVLGFAHNPIALSVNDVPGAVRAVQAAAAEADIVVVTFHGGGEGTGFRHVGKSAEVFLGERRGDLRRFTHAAVDAGAHLVFGHGPHLLRGMERYRGRLIAYSLGNFATYGPFSRYGPLGLSALLEVDLDAASGALRAARVHPLRHTGRGIPQPDPKGAALAELRTLSREDFGANGVRFADDGALLL